MKDKTITKTLWTETLIEILVIALQKKRPDSEIKELIKEIRAKGFKPRYITGKVEKELGAETARRVKTLIGD
jgi:hypothetical protein